MKPLSRLYFYITFCLLATCGYAQDKVWEFHSPSGINMLNVKMENGKLAYSVKHHGQLLITWSSLGLIVQDEKDLQGLLFIKQEQTSQDNTWVPVFGKNSPVKDTYNEVRLHFHAKGNVNRMLNIVFRMYDEGVAFRYEIPRYDDLKRILIKNDATTFAFAEDGMWWAHNGERANLGPNHISNLPDNLLTPVLVRYSGGCFAAIMEAAIDDMAYFTFAKKQDMEIACQMPVSNADIPCRTSWRAICTADNEVALVESDFLTNLNPPCAVTETSWIKPGKSTWNWRARGYKAKDGFVYDVDTETQIRQIDFAARNNIEYHLIDANWYGPEFEKESNPTEAGKYLDIRRVMAHAKEKRVGIFLYLNDVAAKQYGLDTVLNTFKTLGAVGVKYGFMSGSGQEKVLFTREVIRKCAEYQLMLNFHDHPVPPSGDHRTWPHVVAREYGLAQGDNKIAAYPKTIVNQAYIQMLCGPLDMSNGWFDLNNAGKRARVFDIVPSTIAAELAKMIVIFTGFNCLPDAPEAYMEKENMLELIRHIPQSFDSYHVLSGKIDSHISVARRKGQEWFVASLTIEEARELDICLDFLEGGVTYEAHFYEDTPDAHYLHNKEVYQTSRKVVQKGDLIKIKMAPGGGNCIYISHHGIK